MGGLGVRAEQSGEGGAATASPPPRARRRPPRADAARHQRPEQPPLAVGHGRGATRYTARRSGQRDTSADVPTADRPTTPLPPLPAPRRAHLCEAPPRYVRARNGVWLPSVPLPSGDGRRDATAGLPGRAAGRATPRGRW